LGRHSGGVEGGGVAGGETKRGLSNPVTNCLTVICGYSVLKLWLILN